MFRKKKRVTVKVTPMDEKKFKEFIEKIDKVEPQMDEPKKSQDERIDELHEEVEELLKDMDGDTIDSLTERITDTAFGRTLHTINFCESSVSKMELFEVQGAIHTIVNKWCEEHDGDAMDVILPVVHGLHKGEDFAKAVKDAFETKEKK